MKTMVMTGGTSGFGALAAREMLARSDTRLLLGARSSAPTEAESLPLDLASLENVRAFAAGVIERLGGSKINALVLNAGMLRGDVSGRTIDGYETVFAVNHLAHFLLLHLLLNHMADRSVIIMTTSGTHDPGEKAGFPLPRHADAHLLAHPDRDDMRDKPGIAGRRAYTASKLCTILTVRGLIQLSQIRSRNITAIAFCPGQTPGTGLVRGMPLTLRIGWRVLGGPLGRLMPMMSNRETVGHALSSLALGEIQPSEGEYYAALRHGRIIWKQPSELAKNDDARDALWRDSAALVGL